ncbi:1-(5-phosphoribosyl)-5-[(5-phosphoribosylamino)methylideneamino]imidazole-4-carboxamide isomerase [candidate division KSB1 bacterium]|nr:1-(5-phosphoribosyl)-5-[(5-phosphoribosylamino)methylideneamino]imidazole-4-carboxamide isomerase [candidate division KSB1 bacterium]
MIILPAIDLLDSKVVRLEQGVEQSAKIYSDDPLAFARTFEDAGAKIIHVVNLDGAFGRPEMNRDIIATLASKLHIPIELGGGIRSVDQIGFWLNRGVSRVIIGSAAVKDPDMVEKAVRKYGSESIVVGIDMKEGLVAVHGWQDVTETRGIDLARQMRDAGLSRLIITDISTDGMLTGPKLDEMIEIAEATGLRIIASGGVSKIEDIALISEYGQIGIEGAIVGKAIYENRLDIKEAIQKYQHI